MVTDHHVAFYTSAERDASRPVQAVNMDAKKPAFQQRMDLELPMSPIEKPSSLDLMDVSTVSLYHDLPRVSTEKIPHHQQHALGRGLGAPPDGARHKVCRRDLQVAGVPVRPPAPAPPPVPIRAAGPSLKELTKHPLGSSGELTEPLAKRQKLKLDSEVW